MNTICCLCGVPLRQQNDSEEHIILAAIGGRRTVNGVLCRPCNERTGTTWDAELARQLNPLSLFFRISRQRRDTPRQVFETSGGSPIAITPSGLQVAKPEIKITEVDGKLSIRILARDEDQARGIATGLKRKYPSIDVEAALEQGRSAQKGKYLDDFIKMEISIGGTLGGRSIVKSALVLAVSAGVDPEDLEESRAYLLGDGPPSFGYIASKDDVLINRPENTILHCVGVQSVSNMLLAYVELFSVYKILVCLSRSYKGIPVKAFTGINPTTGQQIELDFDLPFTEADVDSVYAYKFYETTFVTRDFDRAIALGMRRQVELERPKAIERAIERASTAIGKTDADVLSVEEQHQLMKLTLLELIPFLTHAYKMGFVFLPMDQTSDPSSGK